LIDGKLEEAQVALGAITNIGEQVQGDRARDEVMRIVAHLQALFGDVQAATVTAESVTDPVIMTHAMLDIGDVLLASGDDAAYRDTIAKAEAIFASVDGEDGGNDWPMLSIAVAHARAGSIDTAIRRARSLHRIKDWAFRDIAKIQAESGDVDGTRVTCALIERSEVRDFALMKILIARIQPDDIRSSRQIIVEMRKLAESGTLVSERTGAFSDIARAYITIGDIAECDEWMQTLKDGHPRMLATVYLHASNWDFPVELRPGPSRAANEPVYPVIHSNPTVFRLFA
jgi:hypothetical protein